jgi:hypothetical protein
MDSPVFLILCFVALICLNIKISADASGILFREAVEKPQSLARRRRIAPFDKVDKIPSEIIG